jgi:hypothetical protein
MADNDKGGKKDGAVKVGRVLEAWITNPKLQAEGKAGSLEAQNFKITVFPATFKAKFREIVLDNPRLQAAIDKLSAISPEIETALADAFANILDVVAGDEAQRDARRSLNGWDVSNDTIEEELTKVGVDVAALKKQKRTVGGATLESIDSTLDSIE